MRLAWIGLQPCVMIMSKARVMKRTFCCAWHSRLPCAFCQLSPKKDTLKMEHLSAAVTALSIGKWVVFAVFFVVRKNLAKLGLCDQLIQEKLLACYRVNWESVIITAAAFPCCWILEHLPCGNRWWHKLIWVAFPSVWLTATMSFDSFAY